MADIDFIRLDVHLHDVANRQFGRRVVQFSPRHNDTPTDIALKLIASCSLSGDRCRVPSTARRAPSPDLVNLTEAGEMTRCVCIEPESATAVLQALNQAPTVVVLFASVERAVKWWRKWGKRLSDRKGLVVRAVCEPGLTQLSSVLSPRMTGHCTLDGSGCVLCIGSTLVNIEAANINDYSDVTL